MGLSSPSSSSTGAFTVSWNSSSTATSYQLQEKKNSGSWSIIHNSSVTSKGLSGKTNGTYYYRVRACNSSGCSAYSSQTTTLVVFPPATPASIGAPSSINGGRPIPVNWSGSSTATSYELRMKVNNGGWSTIYNGGNLNYTKRGVLSGIRAYFRVRACNSVGCSGYSNQVMTRLTNYSEN